MFFIFRMFINFIHGRNLEEMLDDRKQDNPCVQSTEVITKERLLLRMIQSPHNSVEKGL